MEDLIAVARILAALVFYSAAYVLPLTLLFAATARLALRWHGNGRLVIVAIGLALPQAIFTASHQPQPRWMLYTLTALAALAILPYFRAVRAHLGAKLLLEGIAALGVLAYMVSGVKWIVG